MAGPRWTPEELAWLRERYPVLHAAELAEEDMRLFGHARGRWAYATQAQKMGVTKAPGYDRQRDHRTWTTERKAWFRAYVPGHTEREISAEHEWLFGTPLTEGQIGNAKHKFGVRSGTFGGRFERGHEPWQKGRTWDECYSPEVQQAIRDAGNLFVKDGLPHNSRPLLSTRVTKDGFTQIKVNYRKRHKANDEWIPYGVFVWEQHHGQEWPDRCRCMYANHDITDFSPENVVPVPAELYPIVQGSARSRAFEYHDRETLELAITRAKVVAERARLRREAGLGQRA